MREARTVRASNVARRSQRGRSATHESASQRCHPSGLADNARSQEMDPRMHDPRPSSRMPPTATLADPPGATEPVASSVELDPLALQRLRELDPTGTGKLLERVAKAFDAAAARLLAQLHAARSAGDVAAIRLVAHTLKSSAASVGAVKLARQCAEMEAMAKQGRTDDMHDRVAALSTELAAVQAALRDALVSRP
jgi:HPt (histidine-containing phosphotransfer) domain-containing protein